MSDPADPQPVAWWRSPLVWAAVCWALGTMAGRAWGGAAGAWLIGAGFGVIAAAWAWRRGRWGAVHAAAGAVVVCAAAAWWDVRIGVPGSALPVGPEGRLVELEGVIDGEPSVRADTTGAMARFDYRPPRTSFILRADRRFTENGERPIRTGVLVAIAEYDGRLRSGDRVRCIGWLSSNARAKNPGERDFNRTMLDRGVIGRLSLNNRGNCRIIDTAPDEPRPAALAWSRSLRQTLQERRDRLMLDARHALRAGMDADRDSRSAALIDVLLLGQGREKLGDLEDAFRRAGLTHLLAISGLHLGILVAGAWWLVLAATGRPRTAALVALLVIVTYLLIVPARVPVLRAGLMTAMACWAFTWGRGVAAMATMALAALLLLIWRPGDLFNPGFQLSFAVVAGLIAFTRPVAEAMLGGPTLQAIGSGGAGAPRPDLSLPRRYAANYLAVSLVAWCISAPLIAHHFQQVSPVALAMAIVMLPFVAMLLWIGYAKILLTVLWPAAGTWLGAGLNWIGDIAAAMVRWSADLPIAGWQVPPASPLWAAATLAVIVGVFGGAFRGRRGALAAAAVLCTGWLFVPTLVEAYRSHREALRINMVAVGHGSSYLLRSDGEAMIWDCGSHNHLDIATAAVNPALRHLGVRHVDLLVISHPHLDHFSGTLALIDRFRIPRLVISEGFAGAAADSPHGAAAFLLEQVEQRGVAVEIAHEGWSQRLGRAEVRAIWPPLGRRFGRTNDGSLALSIRAAGRRVLLAGDVEQEAMTALLAAGVDLRADVLELPHHGTFLPASPDFLAAVQPRIVLQSTSRSRAQVSEDPWPEHLRGVTRHVTARHGMAEIAIGRDGELRQRRFLDEDTTADP